MSPSRPWDTLDLAQTLAGVHQRMPAHDQTRALQAIPVAAFGALVFLALKEHGWLGELVLQELCKPSEPKARGNVSVPIFKLGADELLYNGARLEDFLSLLQASTGRRLVRGEMSTFASMNSNLLAFREQYPQAAQVVASALAAWCMEHATPDPTPARNTPRL